MKLTSDIHVVGGGYYGFSISGRLDCHVYVINSGTELAIVDPGCGIDRDFEKIISNIRDDGLDPKKSKDFRDPLSLRSMVLQLMPEVCWMLKCMQPKQWHR